ncbi:MAG: hypothetical protein JWM98_1150, partial [Thermoleophilia bacterium]|nr:hypothetical protein [Thermoleophilia bacterium]
MGGSVDTFARNAARLRAGPITAAHVHELDRIIRIGDAAAGSMLPTAGNRFELLDGTATFRDRVIEDIDAAQRHVNVTDYAMHPGEVGGPISHDVLAALGRQGDAGMPVSVIMDAVGSGLVRAKPER